MVLRYYETDLPACWLLQNLPFPSMGGYIHGNDIIHFFGQAWDYNLEIHLSVRVGSYSRYGCIIAVLYAWYHTIVLYNTPKPYLV